MADGVAAKNRCREDNLRHDLVHENQSTPQFGLGKIVMWTLAFQLAWSWNSLKNILTLGALPGPDDFMRLFQVRSLLSGQSWFDSTAYRMLPPNGADIHWSRLIDLPIASQIYLLSPVFGQQLAERITAIIWPTLLLVLTVLVITKICDSLFSRYNRLLPVFFTVLCVSSLAEFVPGRIDHHNVQILLYVAMLWCLVNWNRPLANVLAGIIIPLSISIGLDVLVFIILFMAWFGMEWVLGLDKQGKALRRFGQSLAIFALVSYAINIAPSQWLVAYCDANSIVYLGAQMLIAMAMIAMALSSPLTNSFSPNLNKVSRLAVATGLAIGCMAIVFALFPQCIGGPYSAVSEQLNTRWLAQVSEARNIFTVLSDHPEYWIKTVAYCALIFAAGIWLLLQKVENKPRLAIIFAAFVASIALSFIQFRTIRIGFFAAIPICVLATELIARRLIERFGGGSIISMAGQITSVIVLSTASWAFAGSLLLAKPAQSASSENSKGENISLRKTCTFESDYQLLASLPKGHVISGLNSASPILVFTGKSVVAGPYHRNQRGILDVMDFFLTDVDIARKIALRHKIDYVALCRSSPLVKSNPQNSKSEKTPVTLKSRLLSNTPPSWLHRLSKENDKMLVFGVNS